MATTTSGVPTPQANICIGKSRIKRYNNAGPLPTYYLTKGTEFTIELFNPTQETILAKITLDNKALSQGGLVIKPGERIFLDRYLDVAKKFLFDTYEVSDSAEVQKAIEKNGDFKVQFFKERKFQNNYITLGNLTTSNITYATGQNTTFTSTNSTYGNGGLAFNTSGNIGIGTTTPSTRMDINGTINNCNTTGINIPNTSNTTTPISNYYSSNVDLNGLNLTKSSYSTNSIHDGAATMDWMATEKDMTLDVPSPLRSRTRSMAEPKKVETGRVEKGSESKQRIQKVYMDFEIWAFHTIEAKMLPLSQKLTSSKDINVKRYCTNCAHTLKPEFKFCPSCASKV